MNSRVRRQRTRAISMLAAALLSLGACAQAAAPVGTPVANPEAAAAELRRASLPDGPRQITFAWTLDEAGSRVRGRGVGRMVAPERVRLDLFGPRGETYLAAALVEDEFRLPQGATGAVPLPSPSLLWASVGVVQPPSQARLLSATSTESELILRYSGDEGETIEYRAALQPLRLTSVSRSVQRGANETLQLTWDMAGTLQSTRYRDLSAFRELVLTIEETSAVASFPATIWRPDGTAR
jgi:hypothetical protein